MTDFLAVARILHERKGIKYVPQIDTVILEVTRRCNLKCVNCIRFIRECPSDDDISVEQVERSMSELSGLNIRMMKISGGEPSLHPDIDKIVSGVVSCSAKHAPPAKVIYYTNGCGKEPVGAIARIKKQHGRLVSFCNSRKTSPDVNYHFPAYIAPVDCDFMHGVDYSYGCKATICGITISNHGWYACAVSAAIDNVFGLGVGLKTLPRGPEEFRHSLSSTCRYCSRFLIGEIYGTSRYGDKYKHNTDPSPTWRAAIEKYAEHGCSLSLY